MPFTVSLDPKTGVVRITLSGDVSGDDVVNATLEARESAGEMQNRPQLWDGRRIEIVRVVPETLDALHNLLDLRQNLGLVVAGKRAFISGREDLRSIAELLGSEFEEAGVEIGVFADEESALEWLLETETTV